MGQECYEIHIKGHMGADWSDWFDGLMVANLEGGEALLSGSLADQAALHGVLARLYAMNLTLLGLRRLAPDDIAGRQQDAQRLRRFSVGQTG